jgi:hypothetical protein
MMVFPAFRNVWSDDDASDMLSIDSTETPPLAISKFTSRESELAWTTFIYLKPPSVIHFPCAHPAAHF